ncbi:MAG: hypothetical protein LUH45_04300, partial [Clostridiales bacterium]|nr:hypothetical protein [Clostridiales bacterium]
AGEVQLAVEQWPQAMRVAGANFLAIRSRPFIQMFLNANRARLRCSAGGHSFASCELKMTGYEFFHKKQTTLL